MKIVLIGDSIRLGYQPFVAAELAPRHEVRGPKENCRHSLWALSHFDEWVQAQQPALVHFNFGIHDLMLMDDGRPQIVLEQYRLCLRRFIARVRQICGVRVIWATTTPLFQPHEGAQRTPCEGSLSPSQGSLCSSIKPCEGLNEPSQGCTMKDWPPRPGHDVEGYNAAALEIVRAERIPVDDLHRVVMENDFTRCIRSDGCHMTEFGNQTIGRAVARAILAELGG